MRLDARKGDSGWQCFDVERCAIVPGVMWVDDVSSTWGEIDTSILSFAAAILTGDLGCITHREKRIKILLDSRVVLFNPVDGIGEIETVRDIICELAPPLREGVR